MGVEGRLSNRSPDGRFIAFIADDQDIFRGSVSAMRADRTGRRTLFTVASRSRTRSPAMQRAERSRVFAAGLGRSEYYANRFAVEVIGAALGL
jgi:hypothetical protein